jgi:hypothetical protein
MGCYASQTDLLTKDKVLFTEDMISTMLNTLTIPAMRYYYQYMLLALLLLSKSVFCWRVRM